MQYQVGTICYPTLELATAAWAASLAPNIQAIGTSCTGFPRLTPTGPGAVTVSWVRTSGTCTAPTSFSFTYTPIACAQYGLEDTATMAWGVAGIWIAVFAVAVVMKRAIS